MSQSGSLSALASAVSANPTAISALLVLLSLSVAVNGYYMLLSLRSCSTAVQTKADSTASSSTAPAAVIPAASSPTSASPTTAAAGYRHYGAKQRMKMVMCVRNDLGMGKGKMCGQCTAQSTALGVCVDLAARTGWTYFASQCVLLCVLQLSAVTPPWLWWMRCVSRAATCSWRLCCTGSGRAL